MKEMTRSSFERILLAVSPGTSIMYHTGFLMMDRPKNERLDILAKAAWVAMKEGHVHLVQNKVGPALYQYFAVKR